MYDWVVTTNLKKKMHMMTYIQTQTLLMYRQTIVDVKKCKAVKERKQFSGCGQLPRLGCLPRSAFV